MVAVLPFLHPAVKAVGGNDIQSVAVTNLCGQAEIPSARLHGSASVDGVFHQISEQGNHVKLGGGQRFRKLDVPVRVYARRDSQFIVIAKQRIQRGIGTVVYGRVFDKAGFIPCKMCPDAVDVALFRKGGEQVYRVPEVMAKLRGLAHMRLQCPVLAGLHFKQMGMFFQLCVFQNHGCAKVKQHVNCRKDCKHTALQQQEEEKHAPRMERPVGLGDSHYIEEQKDRGQKDGGVPYFGNVQTVNDPEKKPAGRPCESGCDQAGKSKMEKSRFHREVRCARGRVQVSVKGIGELSRKGLDGTDTHINGKAFRQACGHGETVWEKEQDEGRQEDDICINLQQGAQTRAEKGVWEQDSRA